MTGAPPERAGAAAAVESVSYEFGAGLGVALLGCLMGALYTQRFAGSNSIGEAMALADRVGGTAGDAIEAAARTAYSHGYRITAVVACVCLVAVATTISARRA